ncbi:hypothetical protein [Haloechinothrix halophila]|uniref:hypothetical protein n=1 Tax=Haloechinothrix halophila TaxID=1069073 RepID=UPI00040AE0E9|nr:hypothetical protein [Haloechinothrix halophila]
MVVGVVAGGFGAAVGDEFVDDAAGVPGFPVRPDRLVLYAGQELVPGSRIASWMIWARRSGSSWLMW